MNTIKQLLEKPLVVIPIAAVIALLIGVYGFTQLGQKPAYTFAPIASKAIRQELATRGTVQAAEAISLSFPKGARIAAVNVKIGDHVKAGQVVAALDARDAAGAVAQARSAVAAAEANYQRVIHGATSPEVAVAQTTLTNAQLALVQIQKQQDVAVSAAYRTLLNSKPEAVASSETEDLSAPTISGSYILDRPGQIIVTTYAASGGTYFNLSGLVTGSAPVSVNAPQPLGNSGLLITFSSAGNQANRTWTITLPNEQASTYYANLNAYQLAQQTRDQAVTAAQAAVDQAAAQLALKQAAARPEDVAAAKAQRDSASAALAIASSLYANNFITAPINGVISEVQIHVGEVAAPGAPAVSLISDGALQVETFVSQADLGRLALNNAAEVTLDAYGPQTTFPATVVRIDPTAGTSATEKGYRVILQFSQTDSRLKPGLAASVKIIGADKAQALVIPKVAIITHDGKQYVLRRVHDTAVETEITTGLVNITEAEVTSGLSAADMIVTFSN